MDYLDLIPKAAQEKNQCSQHIRHSRPSIHFRFHKVEWIEVRVVLANNVYNRTTKKLGITILPYQGGRKMLDLQNFVLQSNAFSSRVFFMRNSPLADVIGSSITNKQYIQTTKIQGVPVGVSMTGNLHNALRAELADMQKAAGLVICAIVRGVLLSGNSLA